jgi:pilus assembly protein Flp/PilA
VGRIFSLVRDERGATAIEYGLIVALIVIAMMVSFISVAGGATSIWNNVYQNVISAG